MRCPSFLLVIVGLLASSTASVAEDPVDYLTQIKPLLAERCIACHGGLRQQGGLRLDAASLVRQGGDSGKVIQPGNSQASLLIERISAEDESLRMPPEGEPLKPEQIGAIRRWIDAGAPAPADEAIPATPAEHWSFQPIARPAPPATEALWVENDIDRFIAAHHERLGLQAVDRVSRSLLLRRVYLDLIGLPPTRDELQAFLADESPGAYERTVDELLASPRYGERWGRHWMDVWRYADPSGYGKEIRDSRTHIWRWRDWIIDSLNEDKPYDLMIVEMLAADEAVPLDVAAQAATGFLARNWYKFNRNVTLENLVEHSSKAFLGLTMNCAKCHDHKYDPFEQHEYYQLRAIFEAHDVRDDPFATANASLVRAYDAHPDTTTYVFLQGDERRVDKNQPAAAGLPDIFGDQLRIEPVELPVFAYYPALRPENHEAALATQQAEITKSETAVAKAEEKLAAPAASAELAQLELELARLHLATEVAERDSLVARHAAERVKHGLAEGDHAQLAQAASHAEQAAKVAALKEQRAAQQKDRVAAEQAADKDEEKAAKEIEAADKQLDALAKQIAEAEAKLTEASENYSPLGTTYPKTSTGRRLAYARWIASPNNPLTARVAVNHIWLRHFDAPLVERMFDFGLRSPAPEHAALLDWLAAEFMEHGWSMKHLHKVIVTSGAYRMSTVADEGNLALDRDNRFFWRMKARRLEAEAVRDSLLHLGGSLDLTMGGEPVPHTEGQNVLRRSIYFLHDKERQMTFLHLFDGANPNECYRRQPTVVPQQALAMYNSPIAAAQAEKIAAALPGEDPTTYVSALFELALCRQPTEAERRECESFLAALPDAERARVQLALVLLNHNDFVTVR